MSLLARVCQTSTLRMLICRQVRSAQNNIAAASSCFAVKPRVYYCALEDKTDDRFSASDAGIPAIPVALHLPPHPAYRVLAHAVGGQRAQRRADTSRVGERQLAAGNQRGRRLMRRW
jgi:hypothetical protein